jgi:hypothetical protein
MYDPLSTVETLKTIKQKHDKSLQDYVKCFCNARNATSYIQDIEIINVFHNGVSDIKTIEEITMNKPKTMADLLAIADVCIEASKARALRLESCGKGPQKRSRMIRRSTQPIVEIVGITEIMEIADIAGITSINPQIRRRKDHSIILLMQRCGARSIIPLDTIWNGANIFWITRRCHHQHRWPKNPIESNIVKLIPTMRIRWGRSM